MSKVLSKVGLKVALRILSRIGLFLAIVVAIDAAGLTVYFYSQGILEYFMLMEYLILLMLLEGSLIVAVGGFLFFFSGKSKVSKQKAADLEIVNEQRRRSGERGVSPQMLPVLIMVTGFLLIFIGFLTSAISQV